MTTLTANKNSIAQFKSDVDSLLQKRSYFIERILPHLVENKDYYVIKGRKSLGKAGAEKLASIYQLVATFEKDKETIDSFQSLPGLVAYICTLTRSSVVVGQGRGAAILKDHGNNANKVIKMAQKSAFIDATIRATGLSDIFTQDLESMTPKEITPIVAGEFEEIPDDDQNYFPKDHKQAEGEDITPKQKDLLESLIIQRISNKDERERWLSEIQTCSKFDASEFISSFLQGARR